MRTLLENAFKEKRVLLCSELRRTTLVSVCMTFSMSLLCSSTFPAVLDQHFSPACEAQAGSNILLNSDISCIQIKTFGT